MIPIEKLFCVLVERGESEAERCSARGGHAESLRRHKFARLHRPKSDTSFLRRPNFNINKHI